MPRSNMLIPKSKGENVWANDLPHASLPLKNESDKLRSHVPGITETK